VPILVAGIVRDALVDPGVVDEHVDAAVQAVERGLP
jgi:hypothetical protein